MRGTIWSVVALGVTVAFLPLVFSDTLASNADSVGTDLLELIGTLTPVFGVLVLLAATGLFLSLFTNERF